MTITVSIVIRIIVIVILLKILWLTTTACGNAILSSVMRRILRIPMNTFDIRHTLFIVRGVLHYYNIPFWLTEGTALGAIREGKVIKTDTDIDIGITSSNRETLISQALPLFKKMGFKQWKQKRHIIGLVHNYIRVDIMIVEKDKYCIDIPCNEMISYLSNLIRAPLYDTYYWCMPLAYIIQIYGEDWKIPQYQKKPGAPPYSAVE